MARARRAARTAAAEAIEMFASPAAPVLARQPALAVAPPAWAVEAAAVPATLHTPLPRDFASPTERIRHGDRLVLRRRVYSGHLYEAYERATVFFYSVDLDEGTWGRVDTRRPLQDIDPIADLDVAWAWRREREDDAHDLIHRLCPETVIAAGERAVGSGVYHGPGYVLLTVDPATRRPA